MDKTEKESVMTVLSNFFFFIVALGILVTIHEFGHFWVARKLGVKVLTFSVGFGRPLWQRKGRDGVNYVVAMIPLGGYVKMLDEREGEVAPEEIDSAFNRKSVWARMAIVLAGPIANFILAIVLYWWMFAVGIDGLSTELGKTQPESIASLAGLKAGDKITKVDGEPVILLQDVVTSIAKRLGEKSEIVLTVKPEGRVSEKEVRLNLANWQVDADEPQLLESLGIRHAIHDLPAIIDSVAPDTPAAKAGLIAKDVIVQFNEQEVNNWRDLVNQIQPNAGKKVGLLIEREGELKEISVVIGSHKPKGKEVGFLGVNYVRPVISDYIVTREGSFFESLELAVVKTGDMIGLSIKLFKKLLVGEISPKSLSGPISIAEGAGGSARSGFVYFLSFVAMISVNLGFINLLPIPLLDGGHFLFFSIEAITGKPLSDKVQEIGMQIGMLLVFALMATAIFNDLSRI